MNIIELLTVYVTFSALCEEGATNIVGVDAIPPTQADIDDVLQYLKVKFNESYEDGIRHIGKFPYYEDDYMYRVVEVNNVRRKVDDDLVDLRLSNNEFPHYITHPGGNRVMLDLVGTSKYCNTIHMLLKNTISSKTFLNTSFEFFKRESNKRTYVRLKKHLDFDEEHETFKQSVGNMVDFRKDLDSPCRSNPARRFLWAWWSKPLEMPRNFTNFIVVGEGCVALVSDTPTRLFYPLAVYLNHDHMTVNAVGLSADHEEALVDRNPKAIRNYYFNLQEVTVHMEWLNVSNDEFPMDPNNPLRGLPNWPIQKKIYNLPVL